MVAPLTDAAKDAYFQVGGLKADLASKTGRSARTVLLFSIIRLVISIATTAVLARLLPPEEQGLVAMIFPVIVVLTGFAEFGLPQAIVQRKEITHRQVSALFWINCAFGAGMTLLAIACAPTIAGFYDAPALTVLVLGVAPYIFITILAVPYVAILRRRMEIHIVERCGFAGVIASSVLAIFAALAGAGPWALIIQIVSAQAVTVLAFFWLVKWRPTSPWRADFRTMRNALTFGGQLSVDRLLYEITAQLPTVVIGRAFGEAAAGLFFRSFSLAQMPRRRIVGPLAGAFVPSLARLQDDPAGMRAMYVRQLTRSNLILMPIALVIFVAPDAIVLTLLGPDWVDAIPIMRWLAVFPLTVVSADICSWVLVALGQSKTLVKARLGASLFLIAVMVLASRFDLITFVGCIMVAQVIVALVYMPMVIVAHTPITLSTLKDALGADLIFAICAAGAALLLRESVDLLPLWEGILAGLLIVLLQAIRIGFTPRYRADVRKALQR